MHNHIHARTRGTVAAVLLGICTTTAVAGCDHSAHPTHPAVEVNRAPAQVIWDNYRGIALPVGALDGPAHHAATATGYSHTPQGAALAAMQHEVRMSLAGDDAWPAVAKDELAPGPGADAWITSRVQVSLHGGADPRTAPRIAGYTISSYTPNNAAVTVYTTYPDASVAATDTVVTWTGGDWRLLLPDPNTTTGTTVRSVTAVPAEAIALKDPR